MIWDAFCDKIPFSSSQTNRLSHLCVRSLESYKRRCEISCALKEQMLCLWPAICCHGKLLPHFCILPACLPFRSQVISSPFSHSQRRQVPLIDAICESFSSPSTTSLELHIDVCSSLLLSICFLLWTVSISMVRTPLSIAALPTQCHRYSKNLGIW